MVERYVFVKPINADAFLSGICALGVETDISFRVDAPNGNIMLRIRGTEEAINHVKTVVGYVGMVDRLA